MNNMYVGGILANFFRKRVPPVSFASFMSLIFFLLEGSASFSQEVGPFNTIHQQYQSVRAVGMGGAFASVVDDYSAWAYNPAAYDRLSQGQFQLSLADADASLGVRDLYKQLAGLSGTGNQSLDQVIEILTGQFGQLHEFRLRALELAWARPNWGMALVPFDVTVGLGIHNQGIPAVGLNVYGDTTLAFGYGTHLNSREFGLVSWGMTVKTIMRKFISKEINALDIVVQNTPFSESDITSGVTGDVDFGLLITPNLSDDDWLGFLRNSRPTVALVGRNLLDVGFSTQGNSNRPQQLYRVLDAGLRFGIPKFSFFGGRIAIEERDMGHPLWTFKKGLHTGVEFDLGTESLFKSQWRVGYGQGGPSAGLSFLLVFLRLDFAYFSEELGPGSVSQKAELRLSAEF